MLETLQNMKIDLETTAAHLENLSVSMAGHLLYLDKRGGHHDGVDVKDHIASIQSSAQTLRSVASKIDQDAMVLPSTLLLR